ncbi:hypothetical protein KFE25_000300 [Diacronema lutheri]|uniref:Uncharacterized protein n=1 Tax=Diacronema lutheri TaxID=2081491 RepID=A0A8J5XLZ4_DIALT|nr:hypothetical protein KFE25_000300 [Diacronema lutheri]
MLVRYMAMRGSGLVEDLNSFMCPLVEGASLHAAASIDAAVTGRSSREAARAESEEGAPAAAGLASLLALEFQRQHLTPVLARSVRPPTAGCAHACRY